jgi:hypothetical protein
MAMPLGPMNMPVGELFFGRFSDIHDIDIKVERLIGQGVVQINGHGFVI